MAGGVGIEEDNFVLPEYTQVKGSPEEKFLLAEVSNQVGKIEEQLKKYASAYLYLKILEKKYGEQDARGTLGEMHDITQQSAQKVVDTQEKQFKIEGELRKALEDVLQEIRRNVHLNTTASHEYVKKHMKNIVGDNKVH